MFKGTLGGFLDLLWPFRGVCLEGFQCGNFQEVKQVLDWENAKFSDPKTSVN